MPFCASCGSQVEGSFCAKCGSKVGAAASAPGPVPASGPASQAAPMADNVASALCYAVGFITGIIFLVLAPYNRNPAIRFHAFQSIFLSVAWIVLRIGLGIVLSFSGLWTSLFFLYSLVWLAGFLLWLYILIQTYQGKMVELPVIGSLARQQAGA